MLTNILQYLEATVPQVPDKLAFSTGTEGLTFSELHAHARAVGAQLLRRAGSELAEPAVRRSQKFPSHIHHILLPGTGPEQYCQQFRIAQDRRTGADHLLTRSVILT